jgi:hypothetical protein
MIVMSPYEDNIDMFLDLLMKNTRLKDDSKMALLKEFLENAFNLYSPKDRKIANSMLETKYINQVK